MTVSNLDLTPTVLTKRLLWLLQSRQENAGKCFKLGHLASFSGYAPYFEKIKEDLRCHLTICVSPLTFF
jgi:hypothetical protein